MDQRKEVPPKWSGCPFLPVYVYCGIATYWERLRMPCINANSNITEKRGPFSSYPNVPQCMYVTILGDVGGTIARRQIGEKNGRFWRIIVISSSNW